MARDFAKSAKPEPPVVAPEGTSFFRAVNFERYAVRFLHYRVFLYPSACAHEAGSAMWHVSQQVCVVCSVLPPQCALYLTSALLLSSALWRHFITAKFRQASTEPAPSSTQWSQSLR